LAFRIVRSLVPTSFEFVTNRRAIRFGADRESLAVDERSWKTSDALRDGESGAGVRLFRSRRRHRRKHFVHLDDVGHDELDRFVTAEIDEAVRFSQWDMK